jgi:hypothetical protein
VTDLSYAVILLQRALILHDLDGSPAQWEKWADEASAYMRQLRES